MLETGRFKKAKGQNFLQKGQKVWLNKSFKVTCVRQKGKPFGNVEKDSVFPDSYVTVEVWDKDLLVDYDAKINGVKVRAKCPMRLR